MRNRDERIANILLNAGKVAGVAAITFVTALFVSQRVANPEGGAIESTAAAVLRCVLVLGALLGVVLSWKWPIRGGAAALGALFLVYALDLISVSHLSNDWVLPLAGLSALFFLVGGLFLKRSETGSVRLSRQ